MSPTVYAYEESLQVASAVALYVLAAQKSALAVAPTFKIAVSGGLLGKVLKKGLVDNVAVRNQVQWAKWEVYFSDERIVPLDHADSNCGLFNEMVVNPLTELGVATPTVVAIDELLVVGKDGAVEDGTTEADAKVAADYAAKLPSKFDLVLLGCGPDGHTCSLFPGHLLLQERLVLVAPIADLPKPPPRRITVTFPVLELALNIAFVAEGAGKASVLKEIFAPSPAEPLPLALVNLLAVPVAWFVDVPAVQGVSVEVSKY